VSHQGADAVSNLGRAIASNALTEQPRINAIDVYSKRTAADPCSATMQGNCPVLAVALLRLYTQVCIRETGQGLMRSTSTDTTVVIPRFSAQWVTSRDSVSTPPGPFRIIPCQWYVLAADKNASQT
jgi:hypothetical protein